MMKFKSFGMIRTFSTLLFMLQISIAAEGQPVVSMKKQRIKASELIKEIKKQTGYNVLYSNQVLNGEKHLQVEFQKESLEKVLKTIGDELGIAYEIEDRTIMLIDDKKRHTSIDGVYSLESKNAPMQQVLTGTVKDDNGQNLEGATVSIQGTVNATSTNNNGQFSLNNVKVGDKISIKYVGFAEQIIAVTNLNSPLNITLQLLDNTIEDVVVTSLGIKREAASLTYNVQKIDGNAVNAVKDPSFVNSLTGKVAGLVITKSASGLGGSTKAVFRGNKSIAGRNEALYVVDGIPLPSLNSGQASNIFGGGDGGDGISNINPDDIEEITALSGASAAALYGGQAANGVILITTKKGKAGKARISYSSNATFESPFVFPDFQDTYGQSPGTILADGTEKPSLFSWGPKQQSTFDPKSFFNTGKTFDNAVSISTGTEKNQTYFSAASVNAEGIVPGNKLNRYNFNVRNTTNYFNDKLNLDVNVSYINQVVNNRSKQGQYSNPIISLYTFPRTGDFESLRNFEVYDPIRNMQVENFSYGLGDVRQRNPFYPAYRDLSSEIRNRYLASVTLRYNITPDLNIQGRVKIDGTYDRNDQKYNAGGIDPLLSGINGRFDFINGTNTQTYADVLLNYNKKLNDFSLSATLGGSIMDSKSAQTGTANGYLVNLANFFSASNIDYTRSFPIDNFERTQLQAAFFSGQLGYKDMIYLDVTGRNDWASQLANTPNVSFFYPSVGINTILSEAFELPEAFSFLKIRASYSEVGNPPPNFRTITTYGFANGSPLLKRSKPFTDLRPELTKSYEVGTDLRLFKDRLSFNFTYYHTNTYNQFFTVNFGPSAVYSHQFMNAGNIRNTGIESRLSYRLNFGQFNWTPGLNFGLNRNKIIEMLNKNDEEGILQTQTEIGLGDNGARIGVGGSFGDIYGTDFERDANGNMFVDLDGLPIASRTSVKLGNFNPDYLLGFTNDISYKNLSLSFLIDTRVGGVVNSLTESVMDNYGVTQRTADARDNGGVQIYDKLIPAQAYFNRISGIASQYIYDATSVRLREATIGYTIPAKLFNNKIQGIKFSVVGRNLLMIYKKAPFDPEVTGSTYIGFQGVDYFNQPALRSFGFNLKFDF